MVFIIPTFSIANSLKDVELIDVFGTVHTSESLKGKFVILNFWATWCPPCVEELPELADFYDSYSDKVMILGMNYELDKDSEAITDFSDGFGVSYPNVMYLKNKSAFDGMGIRVLPTTLIFDQNGEEMLAHEGTVTKEMLKNTIFKTP